jgi:hypothetical protein
MRAKLVAARFQSFDFDRGGDSDVAVIIVLFQICERFELEPPFDKSTNYEGTAAIPVLMYL